MQDDQAFLNSQLQTSRARVRPGRACASRRGYATFRDVRLKTCGRRLAERGARVLLEAEEAETTAEDNVSYEDIRIEEPRYALHF